MLSFFLYLIVHFNNLQFRFVSFCFNYLLNYEFIVSFVLLYCLLLYLFIHYLISIILFVGSLAIMFRNSIIMCSVQLKVTFKFVNSTNMSTNMGTMLPSITITTTTTIHHTSPYHTVIYNTINCIFYYVTIPEYYETINYESPSSPSKTE